MNITASTSSSEVKSTSTQTKTNSSTKTSEKSFDEEMVSQAEENSTETTSTEKNSTEGASTETKSSEKSSSQEATEQQTTQKETVDKKQTTNDITQLIQSENIYTANINYTETNTLQNNTQVQNNVQNFAANNTLNTQTLETLNQQMSNENLLAQNQTLLTQNIQDIVHTKDLMNTIASATKVDFDAINMSDSDAEFFVNLVQNTDMSMQSIATQTTELLMQNSEGVQKNIKVSSVLMEKLAESVKTNQPFRIDFDKDVSVIIKVNKDGSLNANFIPGDKAVEQYLKNNISYLRQRFDDENLSYSELSYSNHKNQQEQKRKKENDNE